jgi:hypothetical protein
VGAAGSRIERGLGGRGSFDADDRDVKSYRTTTHPQAIGVRVEQFHVVLWSE